MTLFENPFCILGASMTDDRRLLRSRYDEKSLLSPVSCEEAFHTLVTPPRRLTAELCWFPGCGEAEIAPVLSRLKHMEDRRSAAVADIIRLASPAAAAGELNQLVSLLPYMTDSAVEAALFEACRLLDRIDGGRLLETINASRRKAGIAAITDQADFEDAFVLYQNSVCSALAARLRAVPPWEYDIVIRRVAAIGASPVIDAVMQDYGLSVSHRLTRCEDDMQASLQALERFFNKDERPALTEKIRLAAAEWETVIEPLRTYARAIGSDSTIRAHENRMISDLLCGTYDTLAAQGTDTEDVRLSLARIILQITPEREKYRKLREFLEARIAELEAAALRRQQQAMAEYRRRAEEAWQNEQKRGDEDARRRAREAADRDRRRSAERKKAEEKGIESFRARYQKMRAEEDAAKEKERKQAAAKEEERKRAAAAAAERERAVKRASLETERRMLQNELSHLRGLFSGKRRNQIKVRLAEITAELSKL